jgi:hypothetical protein
MAKNIAILAELAVLFSVTSAHDLGIDRIPAGWAESYRRIHATMVHIGASRF